jgi:peptidoglycan hydrolase-like protein with peptidoglycan-binding domain
MNCGNPTIDGLLNNDAAVVPLAQGASGVAVGYLQDLLRGHGYSSMPDPRASGYGSYGPVTAQVVGSYRQKWGLPAGNSVDSGMLADVVARPAENAVLGAAYVPLVLNVSFTSITRFIWLTSLFETGGTFATLNLNTDQCGLSFGILQWSQKPGQLHTFLNACYTSERAVWAQIIGGTDILDYTAKPNGGLDANGLAIDPNFELTKDPWKSKFEALGASPAIQRVQISLATDTYAGELTRARQYASKIQSERGFAFLLDLGNQFGAGRVQQQYEANTAPGDTEAAILLKLENVFTNIARPQFQPQVRARREFFRTTTMLSDQPLAL